MLVKYYYGNRGQVATNISRDLLYTSQDRQILSKKILKEGGESVESNYVEHPINNINSPSI